MGAGSIIRKDNKILTLITNDGEYDLPKGHADKTDLSAFATAQRETWEECGIWLTKDKVTDQFSLLRMTLFIVDWDGTEPKIKPNPETGLIEHLGWDWVTPEKFRSNCLGYLRIYIDTYMAIVNHEDY